MNMHFKSIISTLKLLGLPDKERRNAIQILLSLKLININPFSLDAYIIIIVPFKNFRHPQNKLNKKKKTKNENRNFP